MTQEKPACHGIFWEGIEGSDCTRPDPKTGKSCSAVDDCLAAFATGTLAGIQAELGADATPERLAEVTSVNVEAIHLAIAFQADIGAGPEARPTEAGPTETAATALLAAEQELQEFCDSPPEQPPAADTPAVPAAKAKKRKSRTWDPRHDANRWKRERERSALIAQLTPNTLLRREYKGEMVEVRVLADGYSYNGKKFPTLYAVVKEVTGTIQCPRMRAKDGSRPAGTRALSNWSAAKFFKLAKLLKDRN